MRKEFLRDVIEHLQGRGATVFFSSHLLYEIEPVADRVAILDGGQVAVESPTEALRESVRRFVVATPLPDDLAQADSLLDLRTEPRRTGIVPREAAPFRDRLRHAGVDFEEQSLSLDEIFEAFVVGRVEEAPAHA